MKPYINEETGCRDYLPTPSDFRLWTVRWPARTQVAWWFLLGLLVGFWIGIVFAGGGNP